MSAKPYLTPSQRDAGLSKADPSIKEPLYGFLRRKVTGAQVLKAMVMFFLPYSIPDPELKLLVQKDGDVNPFTKQPHSAQYKKILESRKKLPVFNQMGDFMKIVSLLGYQ